jgi:thiol:disulfide interchange protein DsbG
MRALLLCTIFGAMSSAALAAAPRCALPNAGAIEIADQQVPPAQAAPLAQAPPAQPPAEEAGETSGKIPASLANLPFVRHVAAAGAVVSDLGSSHGMRSIAARNGDQFMIFQITPDGRAAVSGALTELTAAQLTAAAASGNVTALAAQHGLDALFVRSGAQFQVFYVTPDKERVIPGVLWDSSGKDLTRGLVANVPGAIPTVTVGDMPGSKAGAEAAASVAALPLVQRASAGTVGASSAPHLWMVIDPQCIYSVRAYQMLHPFIEAGKLQLSVIPISVLDYEDNGQSTKSALALLSKSPDQLVAAWQAGSVNDPPIPAAEARLQANRAIAQAIGLQGTPTLIWKKPDGTEGRIDGVPTSIDTLIASIGR